MEELAKSNIMAKQYAEHCNMKYREFRLAINNFIQEKDMNKSIHCFIQNISEVDLKTIVWVEINKNQINQSYINQAAKIAINLAKKYNINADDIISESKVYLQIALYGYTNSSIKLTTYIHAVVSRELTRHILFQHVGISGNSADLLDIKRDYFHAEQCLRMQRITPSYHNVLEYLQYNKQDAKKLMGVMASIVSTHDESEQVNHGQSYFYEDGLAKIGKDILIKEKEINEAKETCDYINDHILNQEEKPIFALLRQGKKPNDIAVAINIEINNVKRIIKHIKAKMKSYLLKEAA